MDIEQVAFKYKQSESTVWRHFDDFKDCSVLKVVAQKHINLVIDTTYFGRSFGYMIFRAHGVNLYYQQVESETIERLGFGLDVLDAQGYIFKSITIDGRTGFINYLEERYPDASLQYCQFHQKQTVQHYITNRPQTLCGCELKEFMKDLLKHDYESFYMAYWTLRDKWQEFLKERNDNNKFKHKRLRSAFNSLNRNIPYLFTHKWYPELKIPNTTNSCDGHFNHFKKRVNRHCGLKKNRRIKLIEFVIKNS